MDRTWLLFREIIHTNFVRIYWIVFQHDAARRPMSKTPETRNETQGGTERKQTAHWYEKDRQSAWFRPQQQSLLLEGGPKADDTRGSSPDLTPSSKT